MEFSNKIEKQVDCLNKIIDHLNFLKQNEYQLAQIEKDIILQDLREAYVTILSMEVVPLEEKIVQDEVLAPEPIVEERQEEEIAQEEVVEEEIIEEQIIEEVVEEELPVEVVVEEIVEEEPFEEEIIEEEQEEEVEEEQIIEEVVEEKLPVEVAEEEIVEEEPFEEEIIKEEQEEEVKSEIEIPAIENDLNFLMEETKQEEQTKLEFALEEPIKEIREPDLFATLETQQTAIDDDLEDDNSQDTADTDMEADDISHFLGKETVKQPVVEQPVMQPIVEEPVMPEPQITIPVSTTPPPTIPEIENTAQSDTPVKRSLNDLLNESKEDKSLNTKFQNVKVNDLTKSISINDKFLFIRELFKNRGEEFSAAIQKLNNCQNIDEAFNYMETLKKQYFWDSTSSAYLTFCDLIRRKF